MDYEHEFFIHVESELDAGILQSLTIKSPPEKNKTMRLITRILCILAVAFALTALTPERAEAQYPVAVPVVQPVVPAVVGYSAERRGLFGLRVVYRPVVAPVAAAPVAVAPTVSVARPVVTVAPSTVARPVVTVARPVVTVARPVVSVAPVATYYAPPVIPVTTYRYPVVYPILSF